MTFSLFKKCSGCKKRKLLIRPRVYKLQKVGAVTSEGLLCGACYSKIRKAIKHQLQ